MPLTGNTTDKTGRGSGSPVHSGGSPAPSPSLFSQDAAAEFESSRKESTSFFFWINEYPKRKKNPKDTDGQGSLKVGL